MAELKTKSFTPTQEDWDHFKASAASNRLNLTEFFGALLKNWDLTSDADKKAIRAEFFE